MLIELGRASQGSDGSLGFLTTFLATLAVTVPHCALHVSVAFDGDAFHATLEVLRLQAGIPVGVDVRRGNHQVVTLDPRAHAEGVPLGTGSTILLDAIEWQGFADAVGD